MKPQKTISFWGMSPAQYYFRVEVGFEGTAADLTNVTGLKKVGETCETARELICLHTESQDRSTTSLVYQFCTWFFCMCEFNADSWLKALKSHRWEWKWQEMVASSTDPVTGLVTLLQELLLWGTQVWALRYSICCQLEIMNIYASDGSFWYKSFAVGTAQPTLPSYSSRVLVPGKSHHHPFFFRFPGVVDHACLMPGALYSRQALAVWGYHGSFLCPWSPFLSL